MRPSRLLRASNQRRLQAVGSSALSSLSNVLAAILVARSFDTPEPFGAFGLAMVVYQLMVGLMRALVGEPLLSMYSGIDRRERLPVMREGLAFTAVIMVLGSLLAAAIGAILGGLVGQALLGLGIILPLVLVHDAYRYFSITDRPSTALTIDAVWVVGIIVGFPLIPADADVIWYVLTWGMGAGAGVVVAVCLERGMLVWASPWRWIRANAAACSNTFGEFLTVTATNHISMVLLAPIGGLIAVSSARASQVFYGPHFSLQGGIYLAVVPDGVRFRREPDKLVRLVARTSVFMALLVVLWMIVGLTMPSVWGETILGANWSGARQLMVPFGIGMVATALSSGGRLGLRSLGDLRRSFRARLLITPWQLSLPLAGALGWGAYGFGVGFAISRVVTAIIWWQGFSASMRQHRSKLLRGQIVAELSPYMPPPLYAEAS